MPFIQNDTLLTQRPEKHKMSFNIKQIHIHTIYQIMMPKLVATSYTPPDVVMQGRYNRFCLQIRTSSVLSSKLETFYSYFVRKIRPGEETISPYFLLADYLYSIQFESPAIFMSTFTHSRFFKLLPVWFWILVDLGEDTAYQQKILPDLPFMFNELELPAGLKNEKVKRKLSDSITILNSDFTCDAFHNREKFEFDDSSYPYLLAAFMMFGYLCLVKNQRQNIKTQWARFLYQASILLLYGQESNEIKLKQLKNIVSYIVYLHRNNLGWFQTPGRFDTILCDLHKFLTQSLTAN